MKVRNYKNLLVDEGKTIDFEKVPTQTEFEIADHGSLVQDEDVKKPGELNILACDDIFLSIDTKAANGKFAFNLLNTCCSKDFLKGTIELNGTASAHSLRPVLLHSF